MSLIIYILLAPKQNVTKAKDIFKKPSRLQLKNEKNKTA
jgi:hypothetical protein